MHYVTFSTEDQVEEIRYAITRLVRGEIK